MSTKILILLFFAINLRTSEQMDIPIAFRRLGNFATGLSFAHLKTSINIGNVRKNHWQALTTLNNTKIFAAELADNSTTIIQLFARLQKSLIPSTNLLDSITSTFIDSSDKTRTTRQLEVLGSVFSIGLSLYNSYEIYNLHSEISSLQTWMGLLAHSLLEEDQAITDLENSVNILNHTCWMLTNAIFKQETKLNHLAAFDEMSILTTDHNIQMNRWGNGMTQLLHGQMSPLLIKNKAMMKAIEELKTKVEEKGFRLLKDSPSDIYKEEISYIVEGNVIHVYVHLPIIEREPLTLYEHINIPFFASNKGDLVTLEADKTILAIDESNHNGMELTPEELSGCKRQPHHDGNIFLCGTANLVRTNVYETCLGLLFSGSQDSERIKAKCKLYISKEESFGQQITKTSFLLFNKNSKKLTQKCGNSQKHEMVEGLTKVDTTPGCQAFTDDYIFYSKIDVTMEAEFINLPRKINFTFHETALNELADAYHELSKITAPKKRSIESVRSWLEKEKSKRNMYFYGLIGFGIAMILSISILCYLGFTYLKYKRAKRPSVETDGFEMEPLRTT